MKERCFSRESVERPVPVRVAPREALREVLKRGITPEELFWELVRLLRNDESMTKLIDERGDVALILHFSRLPLSGYASLAAEFIEKWNRIDALSDVEGEA